MTDYSNSIQALVTFSDLYQDGNGYEYAYIKTNGRCILMEKLQPIEFETKFDHVKRLIATLKKVEPKELKTSLRGCCYRQFNESPVKYEIYWMSENKSDKATKKLKQNPICSRFNFEIFGPVIVHKMLENSGSMVQSIKKTWIC